MSDVAPDEILKPGTVVDKRFKVISKIGAGGMSVVYRAEHLKLHRSIALKVLKSHLVTDQECTIRLQREAVAAGTLEHRNIVQIHGFGVFENKPYIAMEYVDGISLTQLIAEQGTLPDERAAGIFVQVCDAMEHAHNKGIIHRDLKPSNVMVLKDDVVKLVDFGLAKILPESGKDMQKLTQTGRVFGSLCYMSPEQLMGKPLDVRSDIYSFGCLMYEVIVGHAPFLSENPFETLSRHCSEIPTLPNPGRLSAAVLWCMQKLPENRPQTMTEVRQAVVHPSQVSPSLETANRGPVRKRFNTKLVAAMALPVVCALLYVLHTMDPATKSREARASLQKAQNAIAKQDYSEPIDADLRFALDNAGHDALTLCEARAELAHRLFKQMQYREAVPLAQKACADSCQFDQKIPAVLQNFNDLCDYYQNTKHSDSECLEYRRQRLFYEDRHGGEDPNHIVEYGHSLRLAGRTEEARHRLRDAVDKGISKDVASAICRAKIEAAGVQFDEAKRAITDERRQCHYQQAARLLKEATQVEEPTGDLQAQLAKQQAERLLKQLQVKLSETKTDCSKVKDQ